MQKNVLYVYWFRLPDERYTLKRRGNSQPYTKERKPKYRLNLDRSPGKNLKPRYNPTCTLT